MTLVGIQKGNAIVASDVVSAVNDGIISRKILRQQAKTSAITWIVVYFVIALGLMLYGILGILFRKRD